MNSRSLAKGAAITIVSLFLGHVGLADRSWVNVKDAQAFNNDLKDFLPEMKLYSDGNDHYIAIMENFSNYGKDNEKYLGNNYFFGTTGELFQLNARGSGSNENNTASKMGFEDSRFPTYGDSRLEHRESKIYYSGAENGTPKFEDGIVKVFCGDKTAIYRTASATDLEKIKANTKFFPLPEKRRSEYLFKFKDSGKYIYVDASEYNYDYNTFRMFMGLPGSMKEVKIKSVQRFRDGGTTYVDTEEGRLFSPTGFSEKTPTFVNSDLQRLKPSEFDLSSLGISGVPDSNKKLHTPCDLLVPN